MNESQTSAAYSRSRMSQSTSPHAIGAGEFVLQDSNGAFLTVRHAVDIGGQSEKPEMNELSQEEEQKFYKKVFKTSQI